MGLGEESAQKRALSPPLGVWSAEDWSCLREDIYFHPPVTLTQHCDMGWRPPCSGGPEAQTVNACLSQGLHLWVKN